MSERIDRRTALNHLLLGTAVVGLGGLAACSKTPAELVCTDVNALSPDEKKMRLEVLGYVDKTPDATKRCSGCALYKPAAPGSCGACTLVKGPINPDGWCKSFAPKPA